ncbi:MAG: SCP2 sterol-binding domain-containing protein [Candidatus Helarchaeota archaeon]
MGEAKTESENIIQLINASTKAQKILAAENWNVILKFDLDGEPKPFYIVIKDGNVSVTEEADSEPTLIIVGDGTSIARASRGQGDFTHSISREEVEIKKGKIMELIRYGRAISAALKEKKLKK